MRTNKMLEITMTAKYQIFVSSTYLDLKDERDLIIKATLEMGHIPVGMEMFSAADEEQWNIIKRQIDQSDYYVVVVAHRYGSCTGDGKSYTEMEYDYAISKGIPTLGFILSGDTSWPREKSDTDKKTIQKLNSFKEKIKGKHVSFWNNKDDLYGKCSIALMKSFNAYPREGWVRASQIQQDFNYSKELIRLSSENAALRDQVKELEAIANKSHDLEKTIEILKSNKKNISVWKKGAGDWEISGTFTLYQIFETVAPELQVEMDLITLAKFFASNISNVGHKDQRPTWPTPRNQVRSILADFAALNCITPSARKKPISDTKEYWCLDQFGRELLAHMRRRRLEKIENSAKVSKISEDDL